MPKYANAQLGTSSMDAETEILTLGLDVVFFDSDGAQVVTETAVVSVQVSPSHAPAAIHAAMVDALVAHASATWNWTLPRSNVIHPQIMRGS